MTTFTNQATLSYNGTTTTSNLISGELTQVLSVSKTAVPDTYENGDTITYLVSLVNSGATAYNALTVTDNLGAYTVSGITTPVVPLTYVDGSVQYYANGVLQTAPTVTAGDSLVISGIHIPAGGQAMLVYQAEANDYAPLASGSQITNEASVTGTGITTPLTADAVIDAATEPQLSISKALCPSSVTENGQLTYTFTIQNTGNTAAVSADNVLVSDTFNPILNPINVTFNNTSWSSPTNYTYDAATGLFQTVAGQITVPAASYTQNPTTGVWSITPGSSTLTVTGTVS